MIDTTKGYHMAFDTNKPDERVGVCQQFRDISGDVTTDAYGVRVDMVWTEDITRLVTSHKIGITPEAAMELAAALVFHAQRALTRRDEANGN